MLALTFYAGSIEFTLNELPFIIFGAIKLDNGIFNYKDSCKLLKAEKLCNKIDKTIKKLFQYFIAVVELESAGVANKSKIINCQKNKNFSLLALKKRKSSLILKK